MLSLKLKCFHLGIALHEEEYHFFKVSTYNYRQSKSLSGLVKHDKANCLAGEIADELCPRPGASSNPPRGANLQKHMDKCGIDGSTTKDDMVLSACVRKRVPTPVPTNYTQSLQNAKYLNDSKYTGVGIGTEDDWTVLVLTTNTQTGMFAATTAAAYVTICKCVNPVFPLN
nr:uncharacterized GPI-anchored protein At5g19250-like [Ipomoea trifida]